MRKCYFIILAACAALFFISSCAKDQPQTSGPESEDLEELTVEAEVATKTVMNTDNTVDWSVGDAISVFSASHRVNYSFGSSHSAVSHLTTFSGKIEKGTTGVLALYPYTASAAYSGDTVTGMSIPTTQTATETSFVNGASVTIAKGTKAADAKTVVLLFDNLCSVLRFTVPEGIKTSSSIRIESINSDVKMSGEVTINSTTEDITSATTEYVDLSGSFTAGRTYCVTVAPGNYDQGFRFTITGTGGNTLVREAPAVNAEKGKVYNIGALNPVISGDPVTCSISHIYENNTLTGTNATVTLSAPQNEFASNIKGWRLDNVSIKSLDGTMLYRTLANTSSTNGEAVTLLQASGKPYIPHGNYTFSADIYYTVNKADGTPAEKLYQANFTKTVTSPYPDANQFDILFSLSGYTSYSCYMGTDGQSANTTTANNKDNSTIYSVGAAYAGGLSFDVYNQCSNLLTITSYLDDTVASGDKTNQSWAKHTISASASFDGVEASTASKDVHVTGLPYKSEPPRASGSNPWSHQEGYVEWKDNFVYFRPGGYFPTNVVTGYCRIGSPIFHLPSNINVNVQCYVECESTAKHPMSLRLGGNGDQTLDEVDMGGSRGYKEYTFNNNTEMKPDSKYRYILEYKYGTAGPEVWIYYFIVNYR